MGEVRSLSWRAGRGWEALPKGQEESGSGRQALQEQREDLGGPPSELGWVKRLSRRPGMGREGWESSGVHSSGTGGFRRSFRRDGRGQGPSRRARRDQEAFPDSREG